MLPSDLPVAAVLSLFLGVLGIAVTIWLSLAARRQRRPTFADWSKTIFDQEALGLSGIEVEYKGHSVSRLTASRVLLWNGGREAIAWRHLVSADALRIEQQSSGSVLEVRVVKQSHPAIAEPRT
jgi:hypothetical protein